MTYEEAIKRFKPIVDNEAYTDSFQDACKMAIEAMELVMRQNKPKNIEPIPYAEKIILFGKCPKCNLVIDNEWNPESCPVCEHKLDWSEE